MRGLVKKYLGLIVGTEEAQVKLECVWLLANLTYNSYAC